MNMLARRVRAAFEHEIDRRPAAPGFVDGAAWCVRAGARPGCRRRALRGSLTATAMAALLIGGLLFPRWAPGLHGSPAAAGGGRAAWMRDGTPAARRGAAAAYDAARGELVVFGGERPGARFSDTWIWNGSGWRQARPAHHPPAASYAVAAYDAAHGRVILLEPGGETWTWDGADWTERCPAASPPWSDARPPLLGHSGVQLAYDPALRLVVYVGDSGRTTWAWDGSDWIDLRPPHEPETLGVLAYSSAARALELLDIHADVYSHLWTYDGRDWSSEHDHDQWLFGKAELGELNGMLGGVVAHDDGRDQWLVSEIGPVPFDSPTGIPADGPTTMAFDEAVVTAFESGGPWSTQVGGPEPPRWDAAVAYDPTGQRLLVFGGSAFGPNMRDSGTVLDDLWAWDGMQWTRVA